MKRFLLFTIPLLSIAFSIAFLTPKHSIKSDLLFANIEALANNESDKTGTCGWGVKETISYPGGSYTDYSRECFIPRDKAIALYNQWGGNWCCEQCSNTAYCGQFY